MSDTPPPTPTEDPHTNLSRSTYYQIVHDLRTSLPLPAEDTPDAHAHRMNAAIATVASMLPGNAEEASLAARCVGAHAQAMNSLRLARQCPNDIAHVMQCSAQSAAMMRAANGARTLLLRLQAVRLKREASTQDCDRAAWAEYCAFGLMSEVLGDAAPKLPPPPEPEPEAEPAVADNGDKFRALSEADQYAVIHPRRAALIRRLGCVPKDCRFGPPLPALVRAIIASTSPIMLELDQQPELAQA